MSHYERHGPGEWVNYHKNLVTWSPAIFSYTENEHAGDDPAAWFSASAASHKTRLAHALEREFDVRVLGGGWSLNDLLKTQGVLVQSMQGNGAFTLNDGQIAQGAVTAPGALVLASAGMKIHQLNKILEERRLSLRTSGAHDGQSLAGAIATGAHGSVPTFGAIQDHVRGLHIVVSPDKSVWIEPESRPALKDAFAHSFADEIIRSDEIFSAAVIHLGGMGVINAVLMEVEEIFLVELIQRKHAVSRAWIAELQAGEFGKVASRLGFDRDVDPYYIQIILNPFDPYGGRALHRLLYRQECAALPTPEQDQHHRAIKGEPMNLVAGAMQLISRYNDETHNGRAFTFKEHIIDVVMETMFKQYPPHMVAEAEHHEPDETTADKLIRGAMALPETIKAFLDDDLDPDPHSTKLLTWGQAMPAHDYAGDLFSVAFAVDRSRLQETLNVLFEAFAEDDGGDFVVTLRFVPKSAGTMAFTRFDHNVVIDLDGMRTPDSFANAKRILAAFEKHNIPFCLHWGKLGEITPARLIASFGDPRAEGTPANRWRKARKALLPPKMRKCFGNEALRQWGLI